MQVGGWIVMEAIMTSGLTENITNQVPRHNEINERLAKSIVKEAETNPGDGER